MESYRQNNTHRNTQPDSHLQKKVVISLTKSIVRFGNGLIVSGLPTTTVTMRLLEDMKIFSWSYPERKNSYVLQNPHRVQR